MPQEQEQEQEQRITIIGAGTIGLSFVALHLTHHSYQVVICDTRPDLEAYVHDTLPKYLPSGLNHGDRLALESEISTAVANATIVHECLPEKAGIKQSVWKEVEQYASPKALLWSATSGITASTQSQQMKDMTRVCVVHPYNPPHVMPLLEVVPSEHTSQAVIDATLAFWRNIGREPVLIRKEMTGFVANRLAFALFREAVHLVDAGVIAVEDLDRVVETSMGPRWAVAGPFKSYHAGGGKRGLEGFMDNIGDTVGDVWGDLGSPKADGDWRKSVCDEAQRVYGVVDTAERDRITKKVLLAIEEERKPRAALNQ